MSSITYFDACCYLGRHVRMPEGQAETAEEILAAMDHYGIHDALVVDYLAREANPMAGNERIIERTRSHPRLHPAWTGLMTHSRELPPPEEMVVQMREQGVGALFLFYGQFDIRLDDWGVDDLLEVLEGNRVPLFLCPTDWREAHKVNATDWANVVRICRAFPDLPVVVTENRIYKAQRALYAAMEACPNLKLDLSALWLHKRVEFICRHFGAGRLVWGSQLPERMPGSVLMQLNYSDISEDQLSLVAGGTMRELLSWNENVDVVGEAAELSEPVDPLHRTARERLSFAAEEFYDCHGHIGECAPHHVIEDKPADLVREMDKFGVRLCCVFSLSASLGDEQYGNDLVAKAIGQFPDRLLGFTLVNPNHGERKLREELERGLDLGMQGIKLVCSYQGYPTEGPLIDLACAFADKHRLLMLNHHWGSAAQMERLCTTYPNACFFTGHANASYVEITKKTDNLFICTCPFLGWGDTEKYVRLYGADRILFGSDMSDLPIGWGIAQIVYAKIPEEDKRKILGENLKHLLACRHTGATS